MDDLIMPRGPVRRGGLLGFISDFVVRYSRQSRAQFRQIITDAPIPVLVYAENGKILAISQAVTRMTGYEARELPTIESWLRLAYREDPRQEEEVRLGITRLLKSGIPLPPCERTITARNGERRVWLFAEAMPKRLSHGLRYLTAMAIDITERKQAQEMIAEQKALLEAIIGSTPDFLMLKDCNLAYRMVNPPFCRFLGREAEQIIGRTDEELFPPDDARKYRQDDLEALAGGKPLARDEHVMGSEGRRWLQAIKTPVRSATGQVIGLLCTVRDITTSRLAEEALRASEARFRAVLENSLDAAYRRNLQTDRYEYISPVIERVTGFSAEQMNAMSTRDFMGYVHPQDLQAMNAGMASSERTSQGRLVYRFRCRDGRYRWLADHFTVMEDTAGRPLYRSGIIRDVTKQKQAEEALQRLNEKLEQQVTERTAEAESRARQLQALAIQLSEVEEHERERLAEVLHDDLQQTLVAVRMLLVGLNRQIAGSGSGQATIRRIGHLLDEAIGKTRNLSRELYPVVLHQVGLVPAVEWLARQMRDRHGLTVQIEAERWTPLANISLRTFLFRAIQELLFNVVKHSGADQVQVRLEHLADRLEVTVADPGRGFEPRNVLACGRALEGLGLFGIRERITLIGGRFDIDSAPGRGSRFTLTVPLSATASGDEEPELPAGEPASVRLVIAEDYELIRRAIASFLASQSGLEVVGEAADGEEAVQLARRLRPDVVLMDIAMPKLNGIEATRLIRQELPGTRVIGLTAVGEEDASAEKMQEAGAEVCLSKTAFSRTLIDAILGNTVPRFS